MWPPFLVHKHYCPKVGCIDANGARVAAALAENCQPQPFILFRLFEQNVCPLTQFNRQLTAIRDGPAVFLRPRLKVVKQLFLWRVIDLRHLIHPRRHNGH